MKNITNQPKIGNGLVQLTRMGKYNWHKWVNSKWLFCISLKRTILGRENSFNSFAYWVIFHVFLSSAVIFQNLLFWKILSQGYYQSVKQFGFRSGLTLCLAWSGSKLFAKVISRRRFTGHYWVGMELSNNLIRQNAEVTLLIRIIQYTRHAKFTSTEADHLSYQGVT